MPHPINTRLLSHSLVVVLHYIGEKLAYGFGITSPDWQYAIDLYDSLKQEEEEERTEEERALREEHRRRLERLRHLESAST